MRLQLYLLHRNEPHTRNLLKKITFPHGTMQPDDCKSVAIITYGSISQVSGQPIIFQCPVAVRQVKHRSECKLLLQVNGIESDLIERENASQWVNTYLGSVIYRVLVFHLHILLIEVNRSEAWLRKGITPSNRSNNWKTLDLSNMDFLARKVSREALKTIYALGLDYGLVIMSINENRSVVVHDVDPVPSCVEPWLERLVQAMNQLACELANPSQLNDEVQLGADPEFLLVNRQGKVVPASRFLQRDGVVACDGAGTARLRHLYPLAEVRPNPSERADYLIKHLVQTMQIADQKITDRSLSWLAGGMPAYGFALGGHLHFSQLTLNSHLLRVFDNYLALPLMLLEGQFAKYRRPRYGYLGEFRRKSHGGFEYRTLASWLASPSTAEAVFTWALLLVSVYPQLKGRPLSQVEIQLAFYSANRKFLLPVVKQITQEIRTLPAYSSCASILNPLFQQIEALEQWDERANIHEKWIQHSISSFQMSQTSSIHGIMTSV